MECGARRRRFVILWHAGEPLAAGLPFFERAVSIVERHRPPHLKLHHTVQTNGTLIDARWVAFFREHEFSVGVSLDGPAWLHDRSRRDWAGRGTWAAAKRGFDLLRETGMEPGALCVLTAESLLHPDELFTFFDTLGTRWVGFNLEEVENANRDSSLKMVSVDEAAALYRSFMQQFLRRWRASRKTFIVREIEDVLNVITYRRNGEPHFRRPDETQPVAILTVQKNGDLTTYSPEFAGGRCEELNDFVIGNVHTSNFDALDTDPVFRRMQNQVTAGIRRCAAECQWFMFCGGAYTSNKYFENGRLDSTETTACRLHRQVLTETLLESLREPPPIPHGISPPLNAGPPPAEGAL